MIRVHVLLVDDEEDVLFIFEHIFEDWVKANKMLLSFSTSGAHALEILESEEGQDIILILTDINMPGIDGFELLKEVNHRFPNIDTIMISGYSSNAYRNKAKELGALDYFEKPVDFDKLINLMSERYPELRT
ncbi:MULTISPECIES: response regulator [Pseudomonadati]|uniref:response regulator n=1 Tax=unclassified Halobacteriovorax TaxID=2639665 RepID=UPI000CD0156D|nr:response regulator [Halobacteriovorax sp. DA5]POB15158.1 response regulator [Halobacteriovorax sp. DA5]